MSVRGARGGERTLNIIPQVADRVLEVRHVVGATSSVDALSAFGERIGRCTARDTVSKRCAGPSRNGCSRFDVLRPRFRAVSARRDSETQYPLTGHGKWHMDFSMEYARPILTTTTSIALRWPVV